MKSYAKAILYIYPGIEAVAKQIDDIVMRKALASFSDSTSCLVQAERIVENIRQKERLLELKEIVKSALSRFTEEELRCFEYKYFKRKPKSYYRDLDVTGRKYFRLQNRLLDRFCEILKRKGLTEEEFEREYMSMGFVKELVRRIERSEERAREAIRERSNAEKPRAREKERPDNGRSAAERKKKDPA